MPKKEMTGLAEPVLLTLEETDLVAAGGSIAVIKLPPPMGSGWGSWWYLGKPPFTY
jgi:hypothetical protein